MHSSKPPKSQQVSAHDDAVLSFAAWCALNSFSRATGQRIKEAGKGPAFIRLSDRRIGVRVRDNREWQESRKIAPSGA
jgi:hypothetical protein